MALCTAACSSGAGISASDSDGDGESGSGESFERTDARSAGSERELIVLAAPRDGDPYYADYADAIMDFHVAYVEQAAPHDDIVVLMDAATAERYATAMDEAHIAVVPMDDIWMRDFSLSNAVGPVMFRYSAEGQGGGSTGQEDADVVQDTLATLMDDAGLVFTESDLVNDGGNFVDDYAGNAVVSRKFLADNNLSEEDGFETLSAFDAIENVAFIDSDEQGGLEHADGVVAFVDPNVLVVNSYDEDPLFAADLRADLEAGLPGVTIHEITTPYDDSVIADPRFGSACGLYTNMLVTPNRIYFPQFGVPEDAVALEQVRGWTSKDVIPIMSAGVCAMGGGVRCMSWQIRGNNAEQLLNHLR